MRLPVVNNSVWFADGLDFQCTSCGNCCTGGPGFIWISDDEIKRLAAYLKTSTSVVQQRYCRKVDGRISLKEKTPNSRGEYDCIFLKETPAMLAADGTVIHSTRICEIYPVRPLQCRTWPFWEGNLASRLAWDAAAQRCPGMNRGRKWPLRQIISRRDTTDWPAE